MTDSLQEARGLPQLAPRPPSGAQGPHPDGSSNRNPASQDRISLAGSFSSTSRPPESLFAQSYDQNEATAAAAKMPTGTGDRSPPAFSASSSSAANNRPPPPATTPTVPSATNRRSQHNPTAARSSGHRTSHRHHRSSGAFLLVDSLDGAGGYNAGTNGKAAHGRSSSRRETSAVQQRDTSNSSKHGSSSSGVRRPETPEKTPPGSSPKHRTSGSTARAATPDSATLSAPSSSPTVPSQVLDLDSAQIVNMALNLSESRRLAARRNVSQQLPPRLAPLPDSAVGGSLLQQLQQQRRLSRNMSPRPEKGSGGNSRTASGQAIQTPNQSPQSVTSGPLQPPFEPFADSGTGSNAYRYHFSQSTLARAQKAKDYLELLAQERRLLELLPPLTPPVSSRSRAPSLGSQPVSAPGHTSQPPSSNGVAGVHSNDEPSVAPVRLGRPYNPLQYIRNRKVRVRERKTIDGQAQGFGDVTKVAEWVDEVAKWAATGKSRTPGGPLLPPFAKADAVAAAVQSSPPQIARASGAGVLAKSKLPRVDWVFDPADMLADIYWLEQDDNKKLVEDRHWRRVFPQGASLYRPVSRRTDDQAGAGSDARLPQQGERLEALAPFPTMTTDAEPPDTASKIKSLLLPGSESRSRDHSPEHDHNSARQRARQKLHELKDFHHRHNGSFHSHDLLRRRRGSFSETSDSDSDRRKRVSRARTDTGTSSGAEVLHKSMTDMTAKENRERDSSSSSPQVRQDGSSMSPAPATSVTKQGRQASGGAEAPSVQHPPTLPVDSPTKPSRASLEVPTIGRRLSVDYDSSRPTSPELRPMSQEGLGFVPAIGGDLSPLPSRGASPTRHRFGKVKSMFRDHSRERERDRDRERADSDGGVLLDRGSEEPEDDGTDLFAARTHKPYSNDASTTVDAALSAPITATTTSTTAVTGDGKAPAPHSPTRKTGSSRTTAGTFETHRSHGSLGSAGSLRHHTNHHHHHRGEEGSSGGSGLRGFFRGGPRISNILQSGMSKVGDVLWRREVNEPSAADDSSSSTSDEESEAEAGSRGRSRISALPSRSPSTHLRTLAEEPSSATRTGEKYRYLDVMPTFGRIDTKGSEQHLAPSPDPISRPPSRRSSRFERLKPPRIDVRDASPASDVGNINEQEMQGQPSGRQPQRGSLQDSDVSESDVRSQSRRSSTRVGAGVPQGTRPRWSVSQPAYSHGSLSRTELARLRASMYSSAVLAKELTRRANEPRVLAEGVVEERRGRRRRRGSTSSNDGDDDGDDEDEDAEEREPDEATLVDGASAVVVVGRSGADKEGGGSSDAPLTWADIAAYGPDPAALARRPVKAVELYPLAAQVLGGAVQRCGQAWQREAEHFAGATAAGLRQRLDGVRARVAGELSSRARQAADEADEVSRDLVAVQRLQVKRVEDSIDKMLRRRRRRFRWVRRAGWLTVEWVLVGFMWYVWFVVMLVRVVLGVVRGAYSGVRWLLWL